MSFAVKVPYGKQTNEIYSLLLKIKFAFIESCDKYQSMF